MTAEDRNYSGIKLLPEDEEWRPSSVTAEDRNHYGTRETMLSGLVAAVLRDGRGSQHRRVLAVAADTLGWRPSSVTAEDRNHRSRSSRTRSTRWRPSSVTAEDRNRYPERVCEGRLRSGGRPP